MTTPLRIVFAGTPEIALFSLDALLGDPRRKDAYEIVAVLTNPDRRAGRNRVVTPPPVKSRALESGIPVIQPERLNTEARERVASFTPDLLVSVAYGHIFGPKFLDLFPSGGFNVHPSLLPRHRGPSPLQAAILSGDGETGVTIQRIALEMDSGAIVAQETVPIGTRTTVSELHDDLGQRGARLLVDAILSLAAGTLVEREQDHDRATYCGKITKDAGAVDWKESAVQIDRMVRAYTPWPGVRVIYGDQTVQFIETYPIALDAVDSERLLPTETPGLVRGIDSRYGILIQTTDGLLALSRLKPQARKEMDFLSFYNGDRDVVGAVLR